jgi:predicted AlkP superfamily pyrophosphatase or phosphodiesterase
MVSKHVISADELDKFKSRSIVSRDEIWTRAATYLVREHKPNLLLLHFLTLDSVSHRYAPGTLAAYAAIGFLDQCVGRVVAAVHEAGMDSKTSIVVVSDHGFGKTKQQIMPSLISNSHGVSSQDVSYIPEGGSLMIYLNKQKAAALLPKVREAFEHTEGVASVAGADQFPQLGLPVPSADPQMPDLIAYAKTDYGFGSPKVTDGPSIKHLDAPVGNHAYLNSDEEMNAIFIATGYGIKPGVKLGKINNLSVAPTLAKLLGVPLPHAKQPALDAILNIGAN